MNPPHVMTREQAEAYREKFRRDTAPCTGERFQHFTPEQWARHFEEIQKLQESGNLPF